MVEPFERKYRMRRVAILQSNYIPWKGYFDIVAAVDLFIFHDDLQYTKGDWRNRNIIKTPSGNKWITVPCGSSEKRLICDVELTDSSWQKQHWRLMSQSYSKAPYFAKMKEFFEDFYLGQQWGNLSMLNQTLVKRISRDILGIKTEFEDSRKYGLVSSKSERVLELVKKSEAGVYLSGPSGQNYLDEKGFQEEGIIIEWMNYEGYREYPQLYPPFEHAVSIVDLLFNVGEDARSYLKY